MTDHITTRLAGETAAGYAARMQDLVRLIGGIVSAEAGMLIDIEEVIEHLDWIVSQPDDVARSRVFELQRRIDRVVGRMTSEARLRRILFFAQEMSK